MPTPEHASDADALQRPHSKTDLFLTCTAVALQGFGGVLTIIQREMVEKRRWLTRQQFVEDWAVAQILPGPNVINLLIMLGDRYFGVRGAIVAVLGILTVPLCIVLALGIAYGQYAHQPVVQGALRGMGAAAAGLIGAAGIKMLRGLNGNVLGAGVLWFLLAITFIAVAIFRVPLIWAVLGFGTPAGLLAWTRLRASTGAGGAA